MKITVDQIMSHEPCGDYPRERVTELIGDGKTPREIADLGIPAEDIMWELIHALWDASHNLCVEFAGWCALRAHRHAAAWAASAAWGARDAAGAAAWAARAAARDAASAAAGDAEFKTQIKYLVELLESCSSHTT
jgi:hypothetical protein